MRGTLRAPPEPRDADEVIEPDQRPIEIVVLRDPRLPRPIVDRDVGDLVAVRLKQRRHVAVHTGEKRQSQEHLAPVDLDAAAGIGAVVLQHRVADPVGRARGPPLRARVLALLAPAVDQRRARL